MPDKRVNADVFKRALAKYPIPFIYGPSNYETLLLSRPQVFDILKVISYKS